MGKVYDVTESAPTRAGEAQTIYQYAGKDAACIGELDTSTIPPIWLISVATETAPTHSPHTPRKAPLSEALSLKDFEKFVRDQISPKSWAFNSGAANDNLTRDANQTMLQRIWLRPASMRDISTVTTRRMFLGCQFTVPVYSALVSAAKGLLITADLPVMSKREADERLKPEGGRGLVVSINQQQPLGAPPMNANAGLAKVE